MEKALAQSGGKIDQAWAFDRTDLAVAETPDGQRAGARSRCLGRIRHRVRHCPVSKWSRRGMRMPRR